MDTLIETVLIMCAITMSGGWDCDEKWLVIQEKGYGVFDPYGVFVKGVSVYNPWKHPVYENYPELTSEKGYSGKPWIAYGGSLAHDNCWDDICLPMLWHEIKHQQCKCNWHQNMTKGFNDLKIFN